MACSWATLTNNIFTDSLRFVPTARYIPSVKPAPSSLRAADVPASSAGYFRGSERPVAANTRPAGVATALSSVAPGPTPCVVFGASTLPKCDVLGRFCRANGDGYYFPR